ncbi:hypothetical protein OG417_07060 [Actinoallomurus sp. NBC_01490]|uniref:hypothetical protein n=1 Tax=Actinoallomurus sp. NBC_01490 TaxID=2903557 RepID=UPI002E343465|nr:hypothetical protein [Actinoallomurus sp. NBC_01490]
MRPRRRPSRPRGARGGAFVMGERTADGQEGVHDLVVGEDRVREVPERHDDLDAAPVFV